MSERKRCVDCDHRYAVGKSPRCNRCRIRRTDRMKHDRDIRARYSITQIEYDTILESQGGVCYIHGGGTALKWLAVDHNHVTGEVRGLLCKRCNTTLGRWKDDAERFERAAEYLRNPPAREILSERDWSKNLEADRKSARKGRRSR